MSARTEREIEGYTMTDITGDPVSGTMNGNKEIIVWYVEDTDIDDDDTPLDPKPPVDPDDPDDDPDKNPETDPDDDVDIDDGETPLNPAPGDDGASGSGDPDGSGTPDLDIVDDDTPLGDLPKTGMVAAPVNPTVTAGIVAMAMSMAATGMYFLFGRKKKDDEDE